VTDLKDPPNEAPIRVPAPSLRTPMDRLPRPVRYVIRFVQRNSIALVIGILLLSLIAAPLAFLVRMAFSSGPRPSNPGGFSTRNFESIANSPATGTAIWNTFLFALGVTVVSMVVASVCAWLVERTDLPFRNLAWVIMLAPLALPGMLVSMGYTLLLSPKQGVINVATRDVLGVFGINLTEGPFNIYSLGGMILVDGMQGATTVFLMIVGAFRLMDPSLEEAAFMSGKSRLQTFRHITIPMMVPVLTGALIYAFVSNLQDFDTPLVLGLPAGIFVLPTLIYFNAYSSATPNFGIAAAYACLFILVMVVLSYWYYRVVLKRSHRFATVSGKAFRPARIQLGKSKKWALLFFAVVGMLSAGLPLVALLYASLLPVYQPPSWDAVSKFSLHNYTDWLGRTDFIDALTTTTWIALAAGLVTMLASFIISWAVVRLRVRGRLMMDTMAFIPNAVPAVALGLALIMFFLNPNVAWVGIYGTTTLLIIGLVIHYLAYATRVSNGAMAQMSAELEEAAWVSGVGKLRTLFWVTFPVVMPTLIGGAIWVFAKSYKNLTLPLLLSSPNTKTFSMLIYETWTSRGNITGAAALGILLITMLTLLAVLARRLIAKGFSEG
jgi:iron(III) transport system permease protein